MRCDVDWPVIFPASNDPLVSDHQEGRRKRHTIGFPSPGVGPAGNRTQQGTTQAGSNSAAGRRSRVLIHVTVSLCTQQWFIQAGLRPGGRCPAEGETEWL